MAVVSCPQCAGDDLERQGDSADDGLVIRCMTCNQVFTRQPNISCRRCGSADVSVREYEGWAYDDIEEAREEPGGGTWSYYDRLEFRCMKCNFTWRKSGTARPYDASTSGD